MLMRLDYECHLCYLVLGTIIHVCMLAYRTSNLNIFGIYCPQAWTGDPWYRQLILAVTGITNVLSMTGWLVTAFDYFVVVIGPVQMMCILIACYSRVMLCFLFSFLKLAWFIGFSPECFFSLLIVQWLFSIKQLLYIVDDNMWADLKIKATWSSKSSWSYVQHKV